jgi:hypothetical protein
MAAYLALLAELMIHYGHLIGGPWHHPIQIALASISIAGIFISTIMNWREHARRRGH